MRETAAMRLALNMVLVSPRPLSRWLRTMRYFNVYGPRQAFNPYSGVITIFIRRLLEGKPPIVFGDGKQTRDFIYVGDVAEANLLALRCESAVGKPMNVGTGKATKIGDLACTLMELVKVRVEPVYERQREGDIEDSYADTSRAAEILGFRAETTLRTGLKKTVETISCETSNR
jgi:UDP-glucose 4-epimerase